MTGEQTPPPPPPTNNNRSIEQEIALRAKLAEAQDLNVQQETSFAETIKDSLNSMKLSVEQGGKLSNVIANLGKTDGLSNFVNSNSTAMNMLAVATLGASKAFAGLNNPNISNINLFTNQIQEMTANTSNVAKLGEAFTSITGKSIPTDILKAGASAVKGYMMSFAGAADNQLKLQQTTIGLGAATGDIGNIWNRAGSNLENLNNITAQYNSAIDLTSKATGQSKSQIVEHYQALGTIPGALNTNISLLNGSGNSMSMLTAATKLAAGTGRDFKSVTDDMHKALRTYNATGADALKFTANMSELSSSLNVELSDVKGYMEDVANTFGTLGNQTDSAARSFNTLFKAFQETGLSSANSTRIIKDMTSGIGNLTIAQKGFLSSQTGGAGGLMGGFQIDLLTKQGKLDEVMSKQMQLLKKQFGGKVATLEDAAKSPEAAAQLQKQIAMTKQGPMGSMVKNEQDAYKLFEAMNKGVDFKNVKKEFTGEKGTKDPLKEGIDRGTKMQERQSSLLTKANTELEMIRSNTAAFSLNKVQGLTATPGGSDATRKAITDYQNDGVKEGSVNTNRLKESKARDYGSDELGKHLKGFIGIAKQAMDVAGEVGKKMTDTPQARNKKELQNIKNNAANNVAKASHMTKPPNRLMKGIEASVGRDHDREIVSNATRRNVNESKKPVAPGDHKVYKEQESVAGPQSIKVHVTGYCIKCHNEMDNSDHVNQVTQAPNGKPSTFRGSNSR